MPRRYDYRAGQMAAEAAGFAWSDDVASQVDTEFTMLELTQGQVDRLLLLHLHYLKWAIDPSRLTLWQRVKAALAILRGRLA